MAVSRYLDRIAISLSAICIVHCLAVPLVIAVLPVAVLSLGAESHFHSIMLWLVVPISVIGLVMGYREHRRGGLVVMGIVGMTIVVVAATIGHESWSLSLEVLVSVLGSMLLAVAHWRNFVIVRKVHVHHHC